MVGGWGLQSHFHVQPKNGVEVVLWLSCVVVGVVTIPAIDKFGNQTASFTDYILLWSVLTQANRCSRPLRSQFRVCILSRRY